MEFYIKDFSWQEMTYKSIKSQQFFHNPHKKWSFKGNSIDFFFNFWNLPQATIKFHSDASVNKKGFRAEWKAVDTVAPVNGGWSGWGGWTSCGNKQ